MWCDYERLPDGTIRCQRLGCPHAHTPRAWPAERSDFPKRLCTGRAPDGPSPWTRGLTFLKALAGHAWDGFTRAQQDLLAERLAVCRGCPKYVGGTCSACARCNVSADPRAFLNKAAWASETCPLQKWPGEAAHRPVECDIFLDHRAGLGDAVQFLAVVARILEEEPEAQVMLRASWPRVFEGLVACAGQTTDGRTRLQLVDREATALYRVGNDWPEPDRLYFDRPSTKAAIYLDKHFGLQDDGFPPTFAPTDSHRARVAAWLQTLPNLTKVLFHFGGVSWQDHKVPPKEAIRAAVVAASSAGAIPLLLDRDNRWASSLMADFAFQDRPIERPRGPVGVVPADVTPGVGELAALIEAVDLFVGIDSGPSHLAATTETPSIVCWTGHHPLHYQGPSESVFHLLPTDSHELLRPGPVYQALAFFRANYRYGVYTDLAESLSGAIRKELSRAG